MVFTTIATNLHCLPIRPDPRVPCNLQCLLIAAKLSIANAGDGLVLWLRGSLTRNHIVNIALSSQHPDNQHSLGIERDSPQIFRNTLTQEIGECYLFRCTDSIE